MQKWERCRGYMCTTRLPQLWIGAPTRIVCMCDSKYMKMAYTTFVSVRGADTIFDAAYKGNMLCMRMHACACFCRSAWNHPMTYVPFFFLEFPPTKDSLLCNQFSPFFSMLCQEESVHTCIASTSIPFCMFLAGGPYKQMQFNTS